MNTEITRLNLENEMDVVLAHKRSIAIGAALNLPISSQTSFTTAISECCRVVIEKASAGELIIFVLVKEEKYQLGAMVRYKGEEEEKYRKPEPSFDYAKRLVDQFTLGFDDPLSVVEMRINFPKSARLTPDRLAEIVERFRNEFPSNPYEQVKRKKDELNRIASEQEEQLIRSRYINEKKTEFLSIASHELKTPLTTIKAFAQLALADEGECHPTIRMYLEKINSQSDKLYKLIQQLLDVSKVESGQLDFSWDEVGMNGFIQDTLSLISKSMPTHRILLKLQEEVIARVDRLRLEQVFSNILINAAKYSRERSLITVTTLLMPDNLFRISIRDEGIGMTAQNMKRVFEKFFRVEEISKNYSGLGMGLYIASKIVAGHGGEIWIESEPGKGSVFHFSLPVIFSVKADATNTLYNQQ